MCGIVGVAGSLAKKEEDTFSEFLVIDSIRGEDSTGAAFINRANETSIAKCVGDPFQLFDTKAYQMGMRQANKCIIGHNRSATVGKVVRKNAHPFEFPSLVGVHNGTLRTKHNLERHMDFDTDSEAVFFNIDKNGLEATIKEINGAYTFVWYNKYENTINFLRNDERPLYLTFTEDKKQLFWASESWMLYALLTRKEFKPQAAINLPPNEHWAIEIPATSKEFDEPIKQEMKPRVFTKGTGTASSTTTTSTSNKGTKHGNIIHLPPYPKASDALKGKTTIIRPISWTKDSNGALVIDALSHEFPMKRFKIYAHDEEECKNVFKVKRWNAVIGGAHGTGPNCYKINILSLSLVEDTPAPIIPRAKVWKKGHNGYMLDKEEFDKKYTECSFCSGELDFDTDWKAMSDEHCICIHCLADQEIVAYLPNVFS